jgi:hypothetical protein
MAISPYCREIEAYLCRKNDGHLIRLVGPAFDRVCDWERRGVPLKVAFHGIDRYFDRYHAKGPRRWPVRLEFCENDVLDVFDEWRRALGLPPGVVGEASANGVDPDEKEPRRVGLQKHLDRVAERLTGLRVKHEAGDAFGRALDRALDALEGLRAAAKGARSDRRVRLLAELDALDRSLVEASKETLSPRTLARLEQEAVRELEPFRSRMAPDALEAAVARSVVRLIRQETGLPEIGV